MFAYNQPTQFDINALFNALQPQYVEKQPRRASPKILKKVETEEQYQIQIFKESGNFNSYEVKVVKATPQQQGPFFFHNPQAQAQLVNIVIQSQEDDFKKVFQFRLQDIDLKNIDWQWFQSENVLVLSIPKKVRVCEDYSSLFGIPVQFQFSPYDRCGGDSCRAEPSREQERADARADARAEARKAAEAARREAESARREAEKIRREAERARREAEEKARRDAEEKARKEAERIRKEAEKARREAADRARKEAEKAAEAKRASDRARRVAEERAKREAEVHARNQRASQEKQRAKPTNPQEEFIAEFLSQFLGPQFAAPNQAPQQKTPSRGTSFERPHFYAPQEGSSSRRPQFAGPFGQFASQFQQPQAPAQAPAQAPKETKKTEPAAHADSDSESIVSEPETASSNNSATASPVKVDEKLHRSPSLEEVEDEEFVLFRKRFGQ